MPTEDASHAVREAQRAFEQARSRAWLDRIRAGLDYRRALREVEDGIARARAERDRRVREAVAAGSSYRHVARELGLSHSRVQQIVNEGRVGGAPPLRADAAEATSPR